MHEPLQRLVLAWENWARTADKSLGDGWESDFPDYASMLDAAASLLKQPHLDELCFHWLVQFLIHTEYHEPIAAELAEAQRAGHGVLDRLGGVDAWQVRWQVAEAAGRCGPTGEPILRELAKDSSPWVRQRALGVLIESGAPDRRELLAAMRSDPEHHVRMVAENLARTLGI